MKDFDLICKDFEQMNPLSYGTILASKSERLLPELARITNDGLDGATVFAMFVLGAVVADGKLTEEEYILCHPLLRAFLGDAVNYDECKNAVREMKVARSAIKNTVEQTVKLIGGMSDELKDDIITVCLMICAIDGKVSAKEKRWIKQLAK